MLQCKLKGVYLLDSMHLFADVTLQSEQLGDVWLISGGQFQEIQAYLSFELRFLINIGFGDLNFFQARNVLS